MENVPHPIFLDRVLPMFNVFYCIIDPFCHLGIANQTNQNCVLKPLVSP